MPLLAGLYLARFCLCAELYKTIIPGRLCARISLVISFSGFQCPVDTSYVPGIPDVHWIGFFLQKLDCSSGPADFHWLQDLSAPQPLVTAWAWVGSSFARKTEERGGHTINSSYQAFSFPLALFTLMGSHQGVTRKVNGACPTVKLSVAWALKKGSNSGVS